MQPKPATFFEDFLREVNFFVQQDDGDTDSYLKKSNLSLDRLDNGLCSIYLLDYSTRQYKFLSQNLLALTGYPQACFHEGGVELILTLMKTEDKCIYGQNMFRKNIAVLKKTDPAQYAQYRFSHTYRIRHRDGKWRTLLQQNIFIKSDPAGNPLMNLGIVTDISLYNEGHKLIHQIEEKDEYGIYKTVSTDYYFPDQEHSRLSERELEILKRVSDGMSSHGIAQKLHLSLHTVNTHRKNMLEKANARNTPELIRYAIVNGLI
jgi:DNA-binding CsgD family transcriptional regulator